MAEECLFCKIFAREISAKEVFRDEEIVAFDDIRPVAPTHVLVIPKEHIPTVHDLTPAQAPMLARMVQVANRMADERKIDRDGYRLVFNKGPQAGQTVYHLHLHLLGGRAMGWPPGGRRSARKGFRSLCYDLSTFSIRGGNGRKKGCNSLALGWVADAPASRSPEENGGAPPPAVWLLAVFCRIDRDLLPGSRHPR